MKAVTGAWAAQCDFPTRPSDYTVEQKMLRRAKSETSSCFTLFDYRVYKNCLRFTR